ncbi:hypothetical protein PORCRE_321 [Porphyromonas crevioricanis JCM 15906]|uniref:Phage holin family protein n=2 Tax=Porphyromonas crevioricanis TaxID=393921 RepID=A0A2X4PR22_9PORP|nr:hypothetical protein [Porphyromonas crevioricanis]GAD04631.1 hypothetical protein PORCRE_321 [Porphyromonas crevioricanis JCM 15906]GAD07212.1 hypothetical protein PORCAN_831 [Porphyromonas crevioricanis JCM 13913]SJZ67740.1 hypothetical protein SAMN02745203_00518 [Porphyromonas crevioricanis]SQH73978.1 Uncharacterised protein [Porphyromonas crevioricanis]
MQNKDFSLDSLFSGLRAYVKASLDAFLYGLGDMLAKLEAKAVSLLLIFSLGFMFSLLALIGLAFGFSRWLSIPIYAGFFCVCAILLLVMLLVWILFKKRRSRIRDFFAASMLDQIEELRKTYEDLSCEEKSSCRGYAEEGGDR